MQKWHLQLYKSLTLEPFTSRGYSGDGSATLPRGVMRSERAGREEHTIRPSAIGIAWVKKTVLQVCATAGPSR